ncbi:MAG: electron transfer flavoprotein subunit alpha [Clostridiales bacterium]|jgi:electron transfer flavoprotein alpha subunit|nr:electron transfer flavoprotein subunit alpha [Clostridiales bacterium]
MKKLVIHNEKITDAKKFAALCPFEALEIEGNGAVAVGAGCKMCGICVKASENGEAEIIEARREIDKSMWSGAAVYADVEADRLHPVTFELIGKARELADKVYVLLIGNAGCAGELLHYGADEVYVYGDPRLDNFQIEPYTAVFEDFIAAARPSAVLVGATQVGRQLAPRVAARLRTGLTADCTRLMMENGSDLIQIRPAFGGDIMAEIVTPAHRPQMATVRYKVMSAPQRNPAASGKIIRRDSNGAMLASGMEVLSVEKKERAKTIEQAEIIVAAGRGVKTKADLALITALAERLGGELACTRPLAERGWADPRRQIGLSGRTVRPKLLIACGVSGAVQFTAGMNNAEKIIAINTDRDAPIFKTAHYGIVGDLYEILPRLLHKMANGGDGEHVGRCEHVIR